MGSTMASLKLQLLGQFRAQSGAGATLSIASKKGQALLAYLALTAGQRHSRDKLAILLWSDRPDDRARHSLRQCVLTLRKVLGSDAESALLADDEGLWLDAEEVEVDALAFEQLVAVGSREARTEMAALVSDQSGAEIIQSIGNIILILRRSEKPDPKLSNLIKTL